MSHSTKDIEYPDRKSGLFTKRRNVLLGLVGIAGSSLALRADGSSSGGSERLEACDADNIGISQYIDQFNAPLPEPVPAAEGLVNIGAAKLWYRDTGGDGEAIILLHPTSLSGHCWGYQERAFSKAGYRVISYSRRGYRGSTPALVSDTNDAVDDLLAVIEALEINLFHLVGSAGGSAVGAGFAARWPEDKRLLSLIVSCALPMFEKSPDPDVEFVFPEKFQEFQGSPRYLRGLGTSYRDVNKAGVAKWQELNARARGKVESMLDTTRMQPFGAISSLSEFLTIKAPTLYISGSADLFCTPVLMNVYAKNTPNAELAIINGAGHSAFWETPEIFNSMVVNHVQRFSG